VAKEEDLALQVPSSSVAAAKGVLARVAATTSSGKEEDRRDRII